MPSHMCRMEQITPFLHQKNHPDSHHFDQQWPDPLALLMNITVNLNALTVKLQDRHSDDINACIHQYTLLSDAKFSYLLCLNATAPDDVDVDTYFSVITSVVQW